MIDIENELYTELASILYTEFPGIFVTGEVVVKPPSFPTVSIIEQSNTTLTTTLTQKLEENHAIVMYQIEVFSNKVTGKKSECKAILSVIDKIMQEFNFTRGFSNPVINFADTNIYRIVTRYQAIAGKDNKMYRI